MRSPAFALSLLLTVGLVACDAASDGFDTAQATAVTLDAHGAIAGDVLYDIEPLAVGETFTATLDGGPDAFAIRSVRAADSYAVTFEPTASTERVIVSYLFDGVPVAASFEVVGSAPIAAADSEEEPKSWHWERHGDGTLILAQDYMFDPGPGTPVTDTPSLNTRGSLVTTPSGERVRVTHVQFEVIGAETFKPEAVRFESPRAVRVSSQDLRRGTSGR